MNEIRCRECAKRLPKRVVSSYAPGYPARFMMCDSCTVLVEAEARVEKLQARVAELRSELDAARARVKELEERHDA